MNESLNALVLGIIQGLTEFLPVSSSGHLELGKMLLGDTSLPEDSLEMTVVLHAATALSTVIVFRRDIAAILSGLFRGEREEVSFSLKIILSMLPAAVVGVLFAEEMEVLFERNALLIGLMLFVTGLLLLLADRARRTERGVSYPGALVIGIAQMIAILPGISRSGATISTAVLLGIDRERAARFSFLMVVPPILGKIAKDLLGGDLTLSELSGGPLLIGFFAALVTGYFACTWMIALVKRSQLTYFAVYCFVVAAIAIIFALAN